MSAEKLIMTNVDATAEHAFDAVLFVAQSGDYDLFGVNNEGREVMLTSGRTALSWGHFYSVRIEVAGAGSALRTVIGGVDGAPKALLDGRKNQKAGEKLIEKIQAALADSGRPRAEKVESFARTRDGRTVPWTGGPYPEA